ncbi:DUF1800 domain-containing protein [Aquabacterium sp.]|uniref:DUF1800 domain-containing protein n=1 Tax=Aquabacterium sp. TaxID=1872578 RepID=UPI002489BD0A|nr:DUF1800 domain-containing protein [Aquabacterium sp.]MDI1350253.1 DUF1800 domain-containing protein [Aquabacterium sp.]
MTQHRDSQGGDLGAPHASAAPSAGARHVAWPAVAALTSIAPLAGCGGGGGDKAPAPAPTDDPQVLAGTTALLPEDDAARFLGQAALSAPMADVTRLVNGGLNYSAWLDEQFAKPARTDTALALNGRTAYQLALDQGVLVLDATGQNFAHIGGDFGLDSALWFRLITSDDVLRQRIVLALSEIFVVSQRNMPIPWGHMACLAYWDLLEQHCFGTFRELIEAITLSPAMGTYLSLRGSQKADAGGRRPDENFARELLQLFTIGLVRLDDGGQPAGGETYGIQDVTELARALTGWDFDRPAPPSYTLGTLPDYTRRPMVLVADRHDDDAKAFLGLTLPAGAGGAQDLKVALDGICAHPNVAPFFARQLIQRLVSSNPEPVHVQRVTRVFRDTGGDLKAVIRAVLMDPLARRSLSGTAAVRRSKLREPMLRFVQWARLVQLRSSDNRWSVGDLSASDRLGQSPLRSPSVFNFFRPGYVPLNSGVSADGFVAPEFQITNESTVIGYANFMLTHMAGSPQQGLVVDYSEWLPLVTDPTRLVDRLNLQLTGRALAAASVDLITRAVRSLPATSAEQQLRRVQMAFYLMLVSPDYLVQR